MANTTIGFGVALLLVGIAGYLGSGAASLTALIPCGFGVLLIIFGAIARNEKLKMHAMHGAVLVGLLGVIGGAMSLRKLGSPASTASKAAMVVLSLVFVVLCVRSFIAARKARQAAV